jgi:uncharacterized protein
MIELKDIKNTLQAYKDALKKKYGVAEIGIFGSYIKNEQHTASDLDLLVEFEKPIDLFTFVHIKNELSDILNVKVDLVMKRALKPGIRQRILKEVITL